MRKVALQVFLVGLVAFTTLSRGFADEHKTYTSSGSYFNYSIEYPSNWVPTPTGMFGFVRFLARAPSGRLLEDSVWVSVFDASKKPWTLEKFVAVTKKIGPVGISPFKILDEGEARISNRLGWFLSYEGDEGDPLGIKGPRKVKAKKYIVLSGTTFYELQYTAAEENYEKYLREAEELMQSLKIAQ